MQGLCGCAPMCSSNNGPRLVRSSIFEVAVPLSGTTTSRKERRGALSRERRGVCGVVYRGLRLSIRRMVTRLSVSETAMFESCTGVGGMANTICSGGASA